MAPPLWAQTVETGSLRIVVQDPTGAVIPNARVSIERGTAAPIVVLTNDRGEVAVDRLAAGQWTVRAEADGFLLEERTDVRVRRGTGKVEIVLPLAGYVEDIVVARDPQEQASDPRGDGFSQTLTTEVMDALPEDAEELAAALEELTGPGAVMTVDGFAGADPPPKAQIQRVRMRRGVFSAQFHERGGNRVEIVTRPGSDQWRSGLQLTMRDNALNARNAFAPVMTPERQRRLSVSLSGPLVRRRTSFSLNVEGVTGFDSNTIFAASTLGRTSNVVRQPQERYNIDLSVHHALAGSHTARIGYNARMSEQRNQGVGRFDLPARAYSREQRSHQLRVGEAGAIGRRLYHQVRLQAAWRETDNVAQLVAPTIRVQDAFTEGGANVAGGTASTAIDIEDELEWSWRSHSFVGGMSLFWTRYHSDAIRNALGTFTFASLADFDASRPITFTQRLGDPTVRYSTFLGAWFLQDDIRIRRNLTMSVGLRHELQRYVSDRWNFGPRAGIVWSPGQQGRTSLRAGAGIFYDWYEASTYEETLQVNGTRVQDVTVRQPGYPDPYGQAVLQILPSGRVQQGDLRLPTVYQGMTGLERALGPGVRFNLGYTVRHGTGILRGVNVNAPDARGSRPEPTIGNVIEIRSMGRIREHELSLGVNGSVPWRNLSLGARYSYARAYDDGNGPLWLAANPLNPDEWGPASRDIRHRALVTSSLAVVPRVRLALSVRANSAPPYTMTTGFDDNGDTVINDRPAGVGRNTLRAQGVVSADARLSVRLGPSTPDGRGGGSPRGPRPNQVGGGPSGGPRGGGQSNQGRGPGQGGRGEGERRWSSELYVQAFNVFNNVNPTGFSGVVTSPFFGQATSAQAARRMEIGLRVGY